MSKLQRIKNILSKNYTTKSKIQSGYRKNKKHHKEGDVWEEQGKKWTMKNGIIITVNKFDKIREITQIPLTCPTCNHLMKTKNDKKFYKLRKQCMNCVIEDDTRKIIDGTFDEYERKVITENSKTWLSDLEQILSEYIDSRDDEKIVTEDGQIEEWGKGYSKSKLKELFSEQIDKIKSDLNTYYKQDIDKI